MIPKDEYIRIILQLEKDARFFEKHGDVRVRERGIKTRECVKRLREDLKTNGHL